MLHSRRARSAAIQQIMSTKKLKPQSSSINNNTPNSTMKQVERTTKSSSSSKTRNLFSSYPPTYADEFVRSRVVLPIHTAESDIFIDDETSLITLSSLFPQKATESSSSSKAWGHPSSSELYHKRQGTTKRHQRKVQWQYNLQMTKEDHLSYC